MLLETGNVMVDGCVIAFADGTFNLIEIINLLFNLIVLKHNSILCWD